MPGESTTRLRRPSNPWLELPTRPPYVLPADRPHVEAFNRQQAKSAYRLKLEMIPEPFMGPRDARLVFLNRNPGAGEGDPELHRANRRYVAALRANFDPDRDGHLGPALLSEFEDTPAGRWCRRSFKALIQHAGSTEELARKMLSVEFHGYHSKSWCPIGITLPSQHYGFWLVECAIRRGATIVIARGRRDWEVAVPALYGYEGVVTMRNPQNSAVTPGNCDPGGFERIIAALG
jgi:hypothetical protein